MADNVLHVHQHLQCFYTILIILNESIAEPVSNEGVGKKGILEYCLSLRNCILNLIVYIPLDVSVYRDNLILDDIMQQ